MSCMSGIYRLIFIILKVLALHRIRGTVTGANNRLDLLRLVTTGVSESEVKNHDGGLLGFTEGWPEDETHDPDVPAVSHNRGLSPCVFVPFNEVLLHVLLHLLHHAGIFWIMRMVASILPLHKSLCFTEK